MIEDMAAKEQSSLVGAAKTIGVASLGGALVGVLAGSAMGMHTTLMNFIGFTSDSLLIGVYLALIYGLVSACVGAVVGVGLAVAAAVGRPARLQTVFGVSTGVLLCLSLFLAAMRMYNQDLYFYSYSFIHSLQGMRVFFAVRTVIISAVCLALGYFAYRLSRRRPWVFSLGVVAFIGVGSLVVNLQSRQPFRQTSTRLPAAWYDASIPKILLIGWDGATWAVMDRLIAAGRMPNTKRLMDRGSWGNLKTIYHTVSPDIWTTIYTGKGKSKHGIYGFDYYAIPGLRRPLVLPPRGLGMMRVLGLAIKHNWVDVIIANRSFRRAVPIWCIMNEMGRSAGVVAPLVSWPAEQVEPFLISNTAGYVAARVKRGEIDEEAFLSGELFQPTDLDQWVKDQILAEERWWDAVGPYLYQKYRPDFFTVYSNQPDGTQHIRWKWMEPQYYSNVTEEDLARYGGAIEYEYVRADSVLGLLLEIAGDSTTVMIVSDHGFSPTYRGGPQQAGHYHGPDGIFIAAGPPIVPGVDLTNASVFDITPTLLVLAGIPVAEDMEGRVLEEIIRPEFLERHPVRLTQTYEAPASSMQVRRSQVEKELYQRLRALGYVGH